MTQSASHPTKAIVLAGRIGLASLFLLGGLNKLLNYDDVVAQMSNAGIEPANVLLPIVVLIELGGGSLVAIGRWMAPLAGFGLAIFTLATNIAFHDFWNMQGQRAALELSLFFKNVTIAGALVYFAGITLQRQQQ